MDREQAIGPDGTGGESTGDRVPEARRLLQVACRVALGAAVPAALWYLSRANYPLFHTLAEIFSVAVALAMFILVWNTRRFFASGYLLFIGIAYLHVAAIDVVHTLAYKGMTVFPHGGSNLATQLWIAGRYLESFSLLVAPLFVARRLRAPIATAAVFSLIVALALLAVFRSHAPDARWFRFPVCYVEGSGLTSFKRVSEVVISMALLGGLALLLRRRRSLDSQVVRLMSGAIVLTVLSELSFSLYTDVYGYLNALGHLLKVASFYLVYRALIVTGLSKPYSLLFRELRDSRDSLRRARDELDERVRQRTQVLAETVDALHQEVRTRRKLEKEVVRVGELEQERIGRDLHDTIGQMLSGISCLSQALSRKLAEKDMQEAREAAAIGKAALDSLNLTRSLAKGLSALPVRLDSLMIALSELASYTERMYGIRCTFACDEAVWAVDPAVATHIYRIVQEAVANAAKHAVPKRIAVELAMSDSHLQVSVRDDGIGIPSPIPPGQGLGMRTMRHRAESIGASLDITPGPEGGTTVCCRVPVSELGT